MAAAGIITEYNPLHMGHVHLMAEARRLLGPETGILCVMSGNYVQRGDFAIVGKHARAAAAVRSGADLVLELPVPWALSSAEGFAAGAVELLKATGAVAHLVFGSEGGEAAPLVRCAEALCSDAFPEALREELRKGDPFPAARQRALLGLVSEGDAAALGRPNDTLGVEYCKALRGSGIQPVAVPRRGAEHDSETIEGGIVSASSIRALLRQGEEETALGLMAPAMAEGYRREREAGRAPASLESCERAVLARLRFLEEADWAALDLGNEGLYRRFAGSAGSAGSLEELLETVKTKRYPLARLRRTVFRAYLGLPPAPPERPAYLRVLAANERGTALLAGMRKTAALPVLTKPAAVRRLGPEARRLFDLEIRADRLYALACPEPAAVPDEWRTGPVIVREG
ncbi:tRNA(Met) cytidine acetate ligase [Oscillibacter sp.]|uniref:tRNA(Met) cytidine acetate ligase n=1 Tax=Oscillibacter sp. TaxID=1945593 RepID=UPI002D7E957C|nr:nucleotidyltransferase family protein [Oscillibacter sp.]